MEIHNNFRKSSLNRLFHNQESKKHYKTIIAIAGSLLPPKPINLWLEPAIAPIWQRRMNKQIEYKLTDEDYRSLFLKADPYEIKDEFGDYAHSLSTIYRRMKKYGLSSMRDHKKNLELLLMRKSNPFTPNQVIRKRMEEELSEARDEAIRAIWIRINDFEDTFKCS